MGLWSLDLGLRASGAAATISTLKTGKLISFSVFMMPPPSSSMVAMTLQFFGFFDDDGSDLVLAPLMISFDFSGVALQSSLLTLRYTLLFLPCKYIPIG